VTENPAPSTPERPGAEPPVAQPPRDEAPESREQVVRDELRDLDRQGDDPLRGSRTSGLWVGVTALGIVLVLLIIFIAQNTDKTTVTFLGWSGQVSVAVALLIAAVAGLFLAVAAGTLRILQLRRRVRRTKKEQKKARAAR
jgi:uncharacterized integral membrane protein